MGTWGHRVFGFPKLGAPLWGGPNNKDYIILGSVLGFLLGVGATKTSLFELRGFEDLRIK